MSVLFLEQGVDVVKLSLMPIGGGAATDFYLSFGDYSLADELSSIYGTLPVYPVLAKRPTLERSMGVSVSIRHTVTLDIYALTDLDRVGHTFMDLQKEYQLHGGQVVCAYIVKPTDAAAGSTGSEIRQRLDIVGVSYNESAGLISLECLESWFKDKELSRKLSSDDFPSLAPAWEGEIGPIVFGDDESTANGVVIDAPFLNSTDLFTGFRPGGHQYDAANVILAKNEFKQFRPVDWVTLDLTSTPDTPRYGALTTAGSSGNLAQYDRGIVVTISNALGGSEVLMYVKTRLRKLGTLTADKGELAMRIYFAVNNIPQGSALRTVTMDASTLTGSFAEYTFHLDDPLVMTNGEIYLITFEWSNRDDTSNAPEMDINLAATGVQHSYRDKTSSNLQNWASSTGIRNSIALYMLGYDSWEAGINNYSYYRLKTPTGTTTDITKIRFKFGLRGLQDDSSGTITGTPYRLLDNPAHIILFLLLNEQVGVAPSPVNVDTAGIQDVADKLDELGIVVGIAVDEPMTVNDLITTLCRQVRMRLYKKRDGKLSLYFPQPLGSPDYSIDESALRADCQVISLQDNDYSTVINSFKAYYRKDVLLLDNDPSGLRKPKPDRLSRLQIMNEDEATTPDPTRQNALAVSVEKYFERQFYENLSYYYSSVGPEMLQNYYLDRYHDVHKRLVIGLPRKQYQDVEMFDTITVKHVSLPTKIGSDEFLRSHADGAPVYSYYDGVPSVVWAGGSLAGEVVGVEESGPYITITLETVGSFERL